MRFLKILLLIFRLSDLDCRGREFRVASLGFGL